MSSQFQEVIGGEVWWCEMEQDTGPPSESVVVVYKAEILQMFCRMEVLIVYIHLSVHLY
jgi:hypothetical protein